MADAAKATESKPPRDMKKLLSLLFAVFNLSVMGAGTFLIYSQTLAYKVTPLTEEELLKDLKDKHFAEAGEPLLLSFDPFIVNLETPRYLLNIEMSASMLDEDGYEELLRRMPLARDAVMKVLQSKDFQNVESLQGKLFLKEQIITALNQVLNEGIVKDIFFNQFVVQSR